jgi:hypothetical protein
VTHGSLMRDIPRLEPDDEFVDRLAQLAAASKPTRGGVVVPVAFRGPAARSLATAAAVAAIAAGAAVAATQLGHPHDNAPVPPISSVGTSGADDNHGSGHQRTARETDPSRTSVGGSQPQGHDSTGPDSSSSTQAVVPAHDDHGSPGSDDSPGDHHSNGTPGDDPTGHEGGEHGGPGSSGPGSDDGSSGPSGGTHDGSGGKDSDAGGKSDSGTDGSGD